MKIPKLSAAWPLLLAGLWISMPAGEIVTPETLFPQLDVILRHAVAQSPRMISQNLDLEMAEDERISARAGLLPSVGGYYSYYQAQDDRADLNGRYSVTKVAYNFSLNQPLFHWGERRNNARIGVIKLNMAKGNFSDGYRGLAQEVRSQYFRLILGKLRKEKAAFYLEYMNKLLKQGEERLAKKVISDAQIFTIRNDTERAQINAERTAFDLESERNSFARLTGTELLTDEQIPDSIPAMYAPESAVQNLLSGYLAQKDLPSVEAEIARQNLEIARLNVKSAKTRLRPKVNFVAGVSQDEQSYSLNVAQKYQVNSYYGGVSVSWSIFDGFSAGAATRSALASQRKLELAYRALSERLAQQAQAQVRLAGFAARTSVINDRYLESGEGTVVSRKEEFKRGVIAEEDVSRARLDLFDIQLNTYTSRADYYTQLCEFLGTVVEDPVLGNLTSK